MYDKATNLAERDNAKSNGTRSTKFRKQKLTETFKILEMR